MTSHLVPTVLNFTGNHITVAPPRVESCIRPRNPSSSSTHSLIVLGAHSAALELGEQSTPRALLAEEPGDDERELRSTHRWCATPDDFGRVARRCQSTGFIVGPFSGGLL